MRRVVSNTGPFISLEKIPNGFRILELLYDQVLIPNEVLGELAYGLSHPQDYLDKYNLHAIISTRRVDANDPALASLDVGEKYAIALALRENLPILLEDRAARRVAEEKGLRVTGIAGVLLSAFDQKRMISVEVLEQLLILVKYNRLPKRVYLAIEARLK